jgi:aconitate hydratase
MAYPQFSEPDVIRINTQMLLAPPDSGDGLKLEKGPNIKPLPPFEPPADTISGPVLLKVGDDISTDEIMPAVLKYCLTAAISRKSANTHSADWKIASMIGP